MNMLKQTCICSLCCSSPTVSERELLKVWHKMLENVDATVKMYYWFSVVSIVLSNPFYCFLNPDTLLWYLFIINNAIFKGFLIFFWLTLACGFTDNTRPSSCFSPHDRMILSKTGDLEYNFRPLLILWCVWVCLRIWKYFRIYPGWCLCLDPVPH